MPAEIKVQDYGFTDRLQRLAREFPHIAFNMMRWVEARAIELTIANIRAQFKQSRTLYKHIWGHTGWSGANTIASYLWSDLVYAPVLELGGWDYYAIFPVRAQALRWETDAGEVVYVSWVKRHPPAKPRPYMGPACKQALHEGTEKLADEWWRKTA